jgi:hypothetical protein
MWLLAVDQMCQVSGYIVVLVVNGYVYLACVVEFIDSIWFSFLYSGCGNITLS